MNGFALGIGAIGLAMSSGSDTLTLEEAIRIAEQQAFSVRAAASSAERARQKHAEARGALGPQLVASSTYTRFDRESTATFGSQTIVLRPIDRKESRLALSLPIDISKNIGRGIDAAKLAAESSKADLEAEKRATRLVVRQSYYDVVQAGWQVTVATQALKNAEQRLKDAEIRFRAGALAEFDVLRFRTDVAQREADLIAANNGVLLSKQSLNNVLGRPIETQFDVEEIPDAPQGTVDVAGLTAEALKSRAELSSLRLLVQSLKRVRESEERGNNPSLAVGATYTRDWEALGQGARSDVAVGTLTLSMPVFDSGITRARVKAARQDEEQAKIRLEQAELAISLEVRQAATSLSDALARLAVAERQEALAAETYRLAVVRFDAGEGIPLEVTDAQTQLTQAQTARVVARYRVLTAYAALQRAVGKDEIPVSPPTAKTEERE